MVATSMRASMSGLALFHAALGLLCVGLVHRGGRRVPAIEPLAEHDLLRACPLVVHRRHPPLLCVLLSQQRRISKARSPACLSTRAPRSRAVQDVAEVWDKHCFDQPLAAALFHHALQLHVCVARHPFVFARLSDNKARRMHACAGLHRRPSQALSQAT